MADGPAKGHNQGESGFKRRDRYTPNAEELKVLEGCRRESFYYRCLPLGILFVSTTQYLTNTGVLKPHPRFGSLFKNIAAVTLAYVIGKLSYFNTCAKKVMELNDSPLADNIRTKFGPKTYKEDWEFPDPSLNKGDDVKPPTKGSRSYDDLRQQNRRGYEKPAIEQEQNSQGYEKPTLEQEPPKAPVKRNKYGDVIE